jgi:hypothetical protein
MPLQSRGITSDSKRLSRTALAAIEAAGELAVSSTA